MPVLTQVGFLGRSFPKNPCSYEYYLSPGQGQGNDCPPLDFLEKADSVVPLLLRLIPIRFYGVVIR